MTSTRSTSTQSCPRLLGISAGIALVGAVLVGCTSADSQSTASPTNAAVPAEYNNISHIHGLGVNPTDGELYAATHYGVFRIGDGQAVRMGDLIQDTMGFTVAGPGFFLGSGHPDVQNDPILESGMPPLLGLIESKDDAVTWQAISLQGEVDFHALAYSQGVVYGFDSTSATLMTSSDLQNWQVVSHDPIVSVTVSPIDSSLLITTTESGPMTSSDGGKTWAALADAPLLQLVSWNPDVGLWGIAPDGVTYVSNDNGVTWTQRGDVAGQPEAMVADPSGIFVSTDQAIFQSVDQGLTWQPVYTMTN